jgi:hypothetical protein
VYDASKETGVPVTGADGLYVKEGDVAANVNPPPIGKNRMMKTADKRAALRYLQEAVVAQTFKASNTKTLLVTRPRVVANVG